MAMGLFTNLVMATIPISDAVQMPPHARVNFRCYTKWNDDRSDLQIIWKGKQYKQPFYDDEQFDSRPDGSTCYNDDSVERLWCTDSGVAGRFTEEQIHYAWLLKPGDKYRKNVKRKGREGHFTTMNETSGSGHSTFVVIKNTFYYYTYKSETYYSYPRLTSFTFLDYQPGVAAKNLIIKGLDAFNILGYKKKSMWSSRWSPIYPAEANAVTVSVEEYEHDEWAVDVVVRPMNNGVRGPFVHYGEDDTASIRTASREIVTLSEYTCKATVATMSVRCHDISPSGRYTWASGTEIVYGEMYQTMDSGFDLPKSLWLFESWRDYDLFLPIVGSGFAPVISFIDSVLWAVEALPDQTCPSGQRLFLTQRQAPSMQMRQQKNLNCEWRQTVPESDCDDPAYSLFAFKWMGPTSGDFSLFSVVSFRRNEYHSINEPESAFVGDASREHVILGEYYSSVHVFFTTEPMIRPALNSDSGKEPTDDSIAAGSLKKENYECLGAVIQSGRVAPNMMYQQCPLISYASDSRGANELMKMGADINQKCENMSTPLIQFAMERDMDSDDMIRTGAAICTHPLNVFDIENISKYILRDLEAASMKSPCEPGFWLTSGSRCSGLTVCPAGHYCPGYLMQVNNKYPCPPGTYNPRQGTPTAEYCTPCPPDRANSAPGSVDESDCTSVPVISSGTQEPNTQHRSNGIASKY